MDEYLFDTDAPLEDVVRWIRAYLAGHQDPPTR
jgi:hypothetical protein